MVRWLAVILTLAAVPLAAFAQSADQVERCFQNPASCPSGGGGQPAPPPAAAPVTASRSAPAPDYTTVLQSPDPDRRKLQESLRTLDRYNGPIDGDLKSEASTKAIAEWQKGHGYAQIGKLTPTEAVTLNNEAARAPIRRLDPSTQTAAALPPPPSNADLLKAMRARRMAARKAAEPKAEAATQSLLKDVKAYVAADGKGIAGDQFAGFAKWYSEGKSAGRTIGDIVPSTEDYGQARAGAATTTEVKFEVRQDGKTYGQCLLFAWVEASPRKNTQSFACDDVAAVEKWKSEQGLKSDWR
jgi:hypothetical protein